MVWLDYTNPQDCRERVIKLLGHKFFSLVVKTYFAVLRLLTPFQSKSDIEQSVLSAAEYTPVNL
jgi:hypothetical protein